MKGVDDMFDNVYEALCGAADGKRKLWKTNPLGYLVASMVAGMFIAFGSFTSMTIGGLCTAAGCTLTKFFVALTFAAALSLVVMAGSELFTGNNLVLGAAALRRRMGWGEVVSLWIVCWIGNLIGSWILVLLFQYSGLLSNEAVLDFFATAAAGKVALTPVQMVLRGILCNICVCLAVWCSFKMTSESGKLVMIAWCILIFMICGFEHSIANMSIIGVALVNGKVALSGYVMNLLFVSVGNIIGGLCFVAVPYFAVAKKAAGERV